MLYCLAFPTCFGWFWKKSFFRTFFAYRQYGANFHTMKTKLDIVATAAIRKSSWLTRCEVPKCDLIVLQEMYDTARKIEDNLEMYWCLSRNDKKVTNFRKEMQCVEDAGLYLVLVSFATGLHGCRRECGATDLCWREEGGDPAIPILNQKFSNCRIFSPLSKITST